MSSTTSNRASPRAPLTVERSAPPTPTEIITSAPARERLLLSRTFPPMVGGLERYISELFAKSALPIHALAPRTGDHPSIDAQLPFGVTRYRYQQAWAQGQRPLLPLGLAAVRRVLMRRPAVIYSDQVQSAGVGLPLAKLLRVPHVVFAYARELNPGRLGAVKRVAFERSDAIIAISSFTREAVQRAFNVPDHVITLIRPGVDLDRFSPAGPRFEGLGLTSSHLVLLAVGRLDRAQPYKGYERSIRLMSQLRTEFPQARLVIVGDGSDRPRLEELARATCVADIVAFAGRLPETDLLGLYRRADLFVHPSGAPADDPYAVEGYGIVFAEAAACGTPSVGFSVGGAVDAVAQHVTGVLTTPDDDAYADAVLSLLRDDERRSRMRGQARAHAERHFGWQSSIAELRALDARLVGPSERPGAGRRDPSNG